MARRYLFGPVTAAFADENLHEARVRGECLAFAADGSADLVVGPEDKWLSLHDRLPADWRPEFIALYLPYTTVPTCLWSAPVPLVGLAADWNLLWHHFRHCLPRCDLVLTDTSGVEALQRHGLDNVR